MRDKMIRKTCFSHTNFNFGFLKKLSRLLPVKLAHSLPGNSLQNKVRTFENDQKNINYLGCAPLFLLVEF